MSGVLARAEPSESLFHRARTEERDLHSKERKTGYCEQFVRHSLTRLTITRERGREEGWPQLRKARTGREICRKFRKLARSRGMLSPRVQAAAFRITTMPVVLHGVLTNSPSISGESRLRRGWSVCGSLDTKHVRNFPGETRRRFHSLERVLLATHSRRAQFLKNHPREARMVVG